MKIPYLCDTTELDRNPTNINDPALIPVIVDLDTREVGCVLVQAGMGGDTGLVKELFASAGWFTAPNDRTARVYGTRGEWELFADEYNARFLGKMKKIKDHGSNVAT